jgi:hypothetical protein
VNYSEVETTIGEKPTRKGSRLVSTVLSFVIVMSVVLIEPGLMAPAFGCSVPAFPADTPVVRFTGRAVKHVLSIEGGASSATFDWTFVVKSWDRSSTGKRRYSGSKITVSVVESPQVPPTTALLPGGAIANSCYGIQLGVTTEFRRNGTYNVTAIVYRGPGETKDVNIISHTVGLLQRSLPKQQ